MKKRLKNHFPPRPACVWVFTLAVLVTLLPLPTYADGDPFQMEIGHWMSLDHYKDADKRGALTILQPKPVEETATQTTPPSDASAASMPVAAATPPVAAPSRAIDLPIMPGINKGFNVQVTTTEDDQSSTPPPVLSSNAKPDIHISDKNWQSPSSTPHNGHSNSNGNETGDETPPLDVRMSYLPDSKITPIPSAEHETAEHRSRVAFEKGLIVKSTQKAAEPAVCAAIDAFKKQQLDAIQSDRQTLKALQDAIASLGLQKQLGFMTNSASALNSTQKGTPINMDVPVSTSIQ